VKHQKVSFLVLCFLMSFASIAFASLTLFWPIEKSVTPKIEHVPSLEIEPQIIPVKEPSKTVQASISLNYQAWRRIYASA